MTTGEEGRAGKGAGEMGGSCRVVGLEEGGKNRLTVLKPKCMNWSVSWGLGVVYRRAG